MSTLDRQRAKKLIAEKKLSLKKGWLRCKHGIVLKRGRTVYGHCADCQWLTNHVEQALTEVLEELRPDIGQRPFDSFVSLCDHHDRGVV